MQRPPAFSAAVALVSLAVATLAACGVEPPSRPAWDVDVLPILQGSCNHCHGETVGALDPETGMPRKLPLSRLDICDFSSELIKQAGPAGMNIFGGAVSLLPDIVKGYLEPVKGSKRASMPPP